MLIEQIYMFKSRTSPQSGNGGYYKGWFVVWDTEVGRHAIPCGSARGPEFRGRSVRCPYGCAERMSERD